MFPGLSYVSSEDGVVRLWHLLANLYWVFYHEHSRFTGRQKKGEGISLTPHYHFHPLRRHLDISRAIAAESLPLRIASSRTQIYLYTYILHICIYIHILYIYIYIYYYYYIYIYIYIYLCIYILLILLRWKYTIIRNFINLIILCLCPFSEISHPPWLRARYDTGLLSQFFINYELVFH